MRGDTTYSEVVPGAKGNYEMRVRFDIANGFVGISQYEGELLERVLLSPRQFRELLAFVEREK